MPAKKLVFLDANIFIYYFQGHPTFGPRVKKVFAALQQDRWDAVTSVLTQMELLLFKIADAEIRRLSSIFLETPNLDIVPITSEIAVAAARVRREYGFTTPDAIQLAVALEHNAAEFWTNDAQLRRCTELRVRLV